MRPSRRLAALASVGLKRWAIAAQTLRRLAQLGLSGMAASARTKGAGRTAAAHRAYPTPKQQGTPGSGLSAGWTHTGALPPQSTGSRQTVLRGLSSGGGRPALLGTRPLLTLSGSWTAGLPPTSGEHPGVRPSSPAVRTIETRLVLLQNWFEPSCRLGRGSKRGGLRNKSLPPSCGPLQFRRGTRTASAGEWLRRFGAPAIHRSGIFGQAVAGRSCDWNAARHV